MALGTVDFGRFSKVAVSVNNAAEVGAFYASRSAVAAADQPGVFNAASKELLASDGIDQQSISVQPILGQDSSNHAMVKVIVVVNFTTLCKFPRSQVTISRTCQMRIRPQ